MFIETKSLYLRQFNQNDSSKVFSMSRESGIRKWIPDQVYENERHARKVLDYLINQYEKAGNPLSGPYVLGVCLRETGELIGHVGLSPFGDFVEVGYAIEDILQRHGYATRAVVAVSIWGIEKLKLYKIYGIVSKQGVLL